MPFAILVLYVLNEKAILTISMQRDGLGMVENPLPKCIMNEIGVNYIVDKLHDWIVFHKIENVEQLSSLEDIDKLKEAYQFFGVDNKNARYVSDFDTGKETFLRGSSLQFNKQWIEDIKHKEFGYHYRHTKNFDNSEIFNTTHKNRPINAIARHGLGYCFTDSLEYASLVIEKLYSEKYTRNQEQIITAQLCDSAKIVDGDELNRLIDEAFSVACSCKVIVPQNTDEEKLAIIGHFLRLEHNKSLAALVLGYDGVKIKRESTTLATEGSIAFTELVITNREKLIFTNGSA